MPTLSLAMIARDEERTIERVLTQAAQFCDELIVVDTGSKDRTVELARACGAKVFHFDWVDDFAAARNYSLAQCTCDWILWLDADDILPPETIEIGKRLKAEYLGKCPVDYVFAPYDYAHDAEGQVTLKQSRERFLRRSANPRWIGRIHETLDRCTDAFTQVPEFLVVHDTPVENKPRKDGRNLRIYEQFLDVETASTRDLYLYGGELRAAGQYERAIEAYKKYHERWPADQYDLFEEPYVCLIDMLECYRVLKRPQDALNTAGRAIAMNATRAEAYALAALTHYECNNIQGAFPLFLAAAACKPPQHGGLVYKAFYSSAVRAMLDECKQQLEAK